MSALSLSDIEDRFMQLASPVIDEFTNQIDSLLASKFSEFQSELASRTQGSTSGFVVEKLKALMDKLAERMLTIKDEYIAQLKAQINSAVLNVDDGTSLDDNTMSSFISDNASTAIGNCLNIFSQESEQVILEGLEGLGIDDGENNGDTGSGDPQDGDIPPPPEDDTEDPENSMSGSIQDSGASETTEGSEATDASENSQEVVTMPTDPPKRKKPSKLSSMLSRKAKKTASGNFRNVPLS